VPYHLCHLEVPLTVARAVLFRDVALTPLAGPVCDVITAAKRDLKAGEALDGVGGFTCYGLLENFHVCRAGNLEPMGLFEGCCRKRDVQKDQVIIWRDVKVRYKQTVLGAAWAIIQPFFTTVVFSLFFGRLTQMPSDDIPYPIFSCAALVPWAFFANRLGQASTGMVTHAGLIKKIYFPRLAIPIARVLAGTVGFVLAFSGCLPHLSPIPAACFRSPGGRYMASTRLLGCLRVFDGSYWAPIRHLGQL
jgi:hypothetical protein